MDKGNHGEASCPGLDGPRIKALVWPGLSLLYCVNLHHPGIPHTLTSLLRLTLSLLRDRDVIESTHGIGCWRVVNKPRADEKMYSYREFIDYLILEVKHCTHKLLRCSCHSIFKRSVAAPRSPVKKNRVLSPGHPNPGPKAASLHLYPADSKSLGTRAHQRR